MTRPAVPATIRLHGSALQRGSRSQGSLSVQKSGHVPDLRSRLLWRAVCAPARRRPRSPC